jgi:hypothetical protein
MIQCGLLKFLKAFYSLQTAFRPLKFTAACSLAAPGCRGGSQLGTQYGYGMAIQLAKWLQSLEPPWPNIVTHPVRYQETFQNDSIRNHNFQTSQLPNYNSAKSCDNVRKHPITPYATFGTFDFLFIACIGGAAGGGLSIAQWIGLM